MTAADDVLTRIRIHEAADRYFVQRLVGWLVAADPAFVAKQLDRIEAHHAERHAKGHAKQEPSS